VAPVRPKPDALAALDLADARIVVDGVERLLAVPAAATGLEGRVVDLGGKRVRLVPLTAEAARRLRELVPSLRPRPFGSDGSSFGFGDRLGRATPGHIAALKATRSTLCPVLAQQSARELARTGRSFPDVLDATTWGLVETGWEGGFGADADHLTTGTDVRAAIDAGFSMVTLDPSAHVAEAAAGLAGADLTMRLEGLPWDRLEDDWPSMRRRHARRAEEAGGELDIARAAAVYGGALAQLRELADPIRGVAVDVEVSVDETDRPTTAFEHAFLAVELERLGVRFTSLAPRLPGRWEKGVDVTGDDAVLRSAVAAHLGAARAHGGHKLSIHSGSDKPSLYRVLADADAGAWHVKTSGTSYLEALRVVASIDPPLFRDILAVAGSALDDDRRSYAISETAGVPTAAVAESALPGLLDDPDVRQCLHVTYGAVLTGAVAARLRRALDGARERYTAMLADHLGAHLRLLEIDRLA
jgi:hypothetical protein